MERPRPPTTSTPASTAAWATTTFPARTWIFSKSPVAPSRLTRRFTPAPRRRWRSRTSGAAPSRARPSPVLADSSPMAGSGARRMASPAGVRTPLPDRSTARPWAFPEPCSHQASAAPTTSRCPWETPAARRSWTTAASGSSPGSTMPSRAAPSRPVRRGRTRSPQPFTT